MTQDEAIQIIENCRPKDIQYKLKGNKLVQDVIDSCSRLPLAIAVIGSLKLENDEDWQNVMKVMMKRDSTSKPQDDYRTNLFNAFEFSIKRLHPELADLFHSLGVFKAVKIPLQSIISLWQQDNKLEAEEKLKELNCKSLITFDDQAK